MNSLSRAFFWIGWAISGDIKNTQIVWWKPYNQDQVYINL